MKTQVLSAAIQREISAINENNRDARLTVKNVKTKEGRTRWELIAAIASIGAIVATVFILSASGVINANAAGY